MFDIKALFTGRPTGRADGAIQWEIAAVKTAAISILVDGKGIEPSTSAMRTPRSPSWANRPNQPLFNQKSCEKWVFEIFDFEGKVRKIGLLNHGETGPNDVHPYGCERSALPAELRAQIGHFSIKKVMKNRFLRYSVLRRNHGKPD